MTINPNELALVLITAITLPWCVWVTSQIYGLRQQNALIRLEVSALNKIQDLIAKRCTKCVDR